MTPASETPHGAAANGSGNGRPATLESETAAELFRRLSDRPAELLRFATAGSVDDGKSTLIGRLLYDSKQVLADQLAHVEQASLRKGGSVLDLSLLTDGLRAEREQGITIDVAYRYFATAQRRFIIADTPGHEQYTRNMVTGASTADLAIVLVDARKGVVAQSKRHAFISAMLGIPHVVVCVNKMDLVNFEESAFAATVEEFDAFAARLELPDVTFIPISALLGDNVVDRSEAMPWYQGPPLLYHLEHVHIASDRNLIDVRFPVQWVIRPGGRAGVSALADYRAYAGQMAGGIMRPGDEVVVLPGGQRSTVASIDTFDGPVEEAFPPMSVALRLADDIDVGRGSTIVRTQNQPTVANRFECLMCWMSERPLTPSRRYLVKHTTRTSMVGGVDVRYRIDVETLRRDASATTLELNDLARVHLELSSPLVFDSYRRNRVTGSLIMIDEATNETVAAGVILDTEVEETEPKTERSPNVRWQGTKLTRRRRWVELGHGGATLWFTGLPGAGKSTVASAVEERLVEMGRPAFLLDGDNLRHGLNGDLGFDEMARAENVRRTAHVARLLADSGTIALVSLVSPYAADRQSAAALHAADQLEFLEVFVDAPLELCEQRDPKGLYKRARAGELAGLTGVGAPYEPPADPALVLGSGGETVEQEVERVLELLRARGIIAE